MFALLQNQSSSLSVMSDNIDIVGYDEFHVTTSNFTLNAQSSSVIRTANQECHSRIAHANSPTRIPMEDAPDKLAHHVGV